MAALLLTIRGSTELSSVADLNEKPCRTDRASGIDQPAREELA